MNYWLMKTEPDEFSIDDLQRRQREPWTGVRNYQARNFLRDGMAVGDGVFFYHSSCAEPGIAGMAEIVSAALPDPTQFDPESAYYDPKSSPATPRWVLREVAFRRKLKTPIALTELRADAQLAGLRVLERGNRLSVLPVAMAHAKLILKMSKSR